VKAYVDALPTIITSDTDIVPYSLVDGVVILDVSDLVTGSGSGGAFLETAFRIEDSVSGFQASFATSGLTANRAYTFPNANGTFVTTSSPETITAVKTFSATSEFEAGINVNTASWFGDPDTVTSSRNQTVEIHANASRPNHLGFLHHSGLVSILTQSASGAIIATITARGHNGTSHTTGNQLRMLGITTEAVQDASRGAYWQFYTTATGGSSNRAVFRIFETGAFGYPDAAGSGVGGAVTQATSKSTGVTLNTPTGQITMNNAALASVTTVGFTLTNSCIESTDTLLVNVASGATANTYVVGVDAVGSGSARIRIRNDSGSPQSEAVVLNYTLIKGANA
jgi:hypothetical protein